jgi:uncharacterized protein
MPRWFSALLFFGTALLVWGGLNYYLYFRLAHGFDLGARARLVLKIAIVALALSYLAGRLVEAYVSETAALPLTWPGAIWMGVFAVAISALLAFDLWVSLPLWVLRRSTAISPLTAAIVGRWGLGAVIALSVALCAWGARTALAGPKVTELKARVTNFPPALQDFTIVAASDIHVGDVVPHSYIDRMVEQINALKPDLVVLIGDLSDEREGGDGRAFRAMGSMQARYGVIAVTGNHEFYSGGDKQVKAIEAAGIKVLRQGHLVIGDAIVIAGIDDPAFGGGRSQAAANIDLALASRPPQLPSVLLAHQPLAVEHAAKQGVDVMLCGHTHGGQLPPFQLITGLAFPFLRGEHRIGGMTLYVNNGAGFWGPPIRIFADPEIVRVTFTAR